MRARGAGGGAGGGGGGGAGCERVCGGLLRARARKQGGEKGSSPHHGPNPAARRRPRAPPPQVRDIVSRLREGRQALLFSATLPRSLADFASAGLARPQLVRLDAERRLSPDLGLAFYTGAPRL